MARIGILPHVIEAVLNHISGHKGGVVAIYNHHTYEAEKMAALTLWAEHFMAAVTGKTARVVPLRVAAVGRSGREERSRRSLTLRRAENSVVRVCRTALSISGPPCRIAASNCC